VGLKVDNKNRPHNFERNQLLNVPLYYQTKNL
jgi:hypothetical protein